MSTLKNRLLWGSHTFSGTPLLPNGRTRHGRVRRYFGAAAIRMVGGWGERHGSFAPATSHNRLAGLQRCKELQEEEQEVKLEGKQEVKL